MIELIEVLEFDYIFDMYKEAIFWGFLIAFVPFLIGSVLTAFRIVIEK